MNRSVSLRTAVAAAAFCLCALGLAGTPSTAEARGGVHPTSGNAALTWYTRLSEARQQARAQNKLLFVEVSRAPSQCRKCRALFGQVLAPRGLGARVNTIAVGMHFDWRGVDRTVYTRLIRNLTSNRIDPMVAFLTADLGFVSGFAPNRNSTAKSMHAQLRAALGKAEARHATMNGRAAVDPNPPVVQPRQNPPVVTRPPVTASEGFRWYRNWNAAAQAARAQGKFIMVVSTKPRCSICEKVKNRTIPVIQTEISRKAIAYTYDITRPESRAIDRLIRSMNRGAGLMPLAGFVTPDLRPLRGFSGSTSPQQLRAHLAAAARVAGRR